jgi:hypothetical protein
MEVCTVFDEFMQNFAEGTPRWEVVLNNNERIFQDDGRPGMQPVSAWERLYHYCQQNGLYITSMRIMFRDNVYELPSNKDGYFFSKGIRGILGELVNFHLFIVGYLENDQVCVTCWKVPELIPEWTDIRDPEKAGLCLITK